MGIDPGLAIVGWGVIQRINGMTFAPVAYGAINTPAHCGTSERLSMIYRNMNLLLEKYHPDEMAVEELFFNTNQKTAIAVAEARGVILLAAMKKNIRISEYTPLQVKQSVVGYGRAEKAQVISLVKMILKLEHAPKLDDTADALALAICHAHCGGSKMQEYYNQKKQKLL